MLNTVKKTKSAKILKFNGLGFWVFLATVLVENKARKLNIFLVSVQFHLSRPCILESNNLTIL